MEFGKAVFKFAIIGFVIAALLFFDADRVVSAMFSDPSSSPGIAADADGAGFLTAVCIATILLVIVDIIFSRSHWRKELRMTRQEVKDEHKQMEGDPHMKAKMRSLARDRSRPAHDRRRAARHIVIANPTPLRHRPALCARGRAARRSWWPRARISVALKIREVAQAHAIPVIEDKPLVRSMYDKVELDYPIPPKFYQVVAELLYLFHYSKGKNGDAGFAPGKA